MTSNDAIDYSGLVQDLLEFGFTTPHVLSEVIDDNFGAGATNIEFHINTTEHEMLIVDNAKGMTKDELVLSHRLFRRSEASDERQGRFGIGSKVAKVHLTQHRHPTTVISKTATSEINQITVDWNKAVTNSILELIATEASRRNEDLWNKYCTDSGTVARIPLHPKIEKELIASLENGSFQKYFSRMYSKDLLEGKVIKFLYDSKGVILTPTDILELDTCTFKQSNVVEVYEKDDDIRLYFVNGNGEKVYKNAEGNQAHDEPTGFTLVGKMKIDSAIKSQIIKESEKWTDWEAEDGGIFIRRMNKVIEQIPIPPTTSGDYGWRCLLNSSRHLVSFNSSLDSYFGIEINKSHVKEANINKKVIAFIRWLTKDFMQKKWAYIKKQNEDAKKKTPPQPQPPQPPSPQPQPPQPPQPQPQPGEPDNTNVIQHFGGSGGNAVNPTPDPKTKGKAKAKAKEEVKPTDVPEPTIQFSQVGDSVCVLIDDDDNYITDGDQPEALIRWLNGLKAKFGAKAFATKFYQWNLN